MKFQLNGALTIGTLDGANVEIREEIGPENIFIFGLTVEEIEKLDRDGYDPIRYYEGNAMLRRVMDQISSGHFCPEEPLAFHYIIDSLLYHGDRFKLLADYQSYIDCQRNVSEVFFKNQKQWVTMSLKNIAYSGKFSSDRTIREYARDIWNTQCLH